MFQKNKELYLKSPLLEINNLKTHFPLDKDVLGRTTSWVKAVDDVFKEISIIKDPEKKLK